ncbi:MAG: carboxymuconolactone decarboxylase family protein [Planctomycetia bacterium]|jgi:AhpD family alkylhydroperoxidase|nr:carboxymuconolactone decarboxylase family protein [Planctomycetia bacterium]
MECRLDYKTIAPDAYQAISALEMYVHNSSLEKPLLELIKTRASQMNGCAFCLDMHTKDARAGGETEQRLYTLSAWRETPFFTNRERAALEWTETITRIADTHAPDAVYESVRRHFTEQEMVALTMAIVTINAWNRLAIAFRKLPGTYQPKKVNSP